MRLLGTHHFIINTDAQPAYDFTTTAVNRPLMEFTPEENSSTITNTDTRIIELRGINMRVKEIQIYNRAPFDNLLLHFDSSNIAVLSGINGAGKTTIISYVVDAFYEFAKKGFRNEFEDISGKFYVISSNLATLDKQKPSFVYIRFENNGDRVDYIDIRNLTSNEDYLNAIKIDDPISYNTITNKIGSASVLKYFTLTDNSKLANLFDTNILTYFPAYRYEEPAYLNDPYSISLTFKKEMSFSGYLTNPIEVTSDLQVIANWIMDIVLDSELYHGVANKTLQHINSIFTSLLRSKTGTPVRLGIGPRHNGATRIQVINMADDKQVYPSIFRMSSGEHALISLFCELTRQADNIGKIFAEVNGIVLVDEIDKHLHIKLQKEVLPELIKLFPNLQFIVTTHSPFFNLGLADEDSIFYKIYNLDNNGLMCSPHNNELFREVYEMMISENDQFASKYKAILAETKESTVPLLITEGKTDWKHLKSAMSALNISDLNIDFYECNDTMGDTKLINLLEQFAITAPNRKIIGLFDRDNETICSQIHEPGKVYKQFSKNIYAISIPTVNEDVYGPYTSIEHYYPKTQLLKMTKEGRRLFLGEEFFESGLSKDKSYLTKAKNIQNKAKVNGVIDEKVYCLETDPECRHSIALSKDDFAQLIYDQDEYASGFDFSEFTKIIDAIREVVNL